MFLLFTVNVTFFDLSILLSTSLLVVWLIHEMRNIFRYFHISNDSSLLIKASVMVQYNWKDITSDHSYFQLQAKVSADQKCFYFIKNSSCLLDSASCFYGLILVWIYHWSQVAV